ncbi:MAG: hypothetical protein JEZ02_08405 [Desulfatibacillum sp.]|nr:hypothetical protein [Desulfatibacillum sp.]
MTRPGWVTAVGIIGIVMACFGLLGAVQQLIMPSMLHFQQEMMGGIQEEIKKDIAKQQEAYENGESTTAPPPVAVFEMMEKMWNMPEWFRTWAMIAGILQAVVCGFILYACLLLLQLKKSAIKIFYWSAGLKMAMAILNIAAAFLAMSFMGFAMAAGGGVSIVVFGVLSIVVVTGDKSAFFHGNLPPPMPMAPPPPE